MTTRKKGRLRWAYTKMRQMRCGRLCAAYRATLYAWCGDSGRFKSHAGTRIARIHRGNNVERTWVTAQRTQRDWSVAERPAVAAHAGFMQWGIRIDEPVHATTAAEVFHLGVVVEQLLALARAETEAAVRRNDILMRAEAALHRYRQRQTARLTELAPQAWTGILEPFKPQPRNDPSLAVETRDDQYANGGVCRMT